MGGINEPIEAKATPNTLYVLNPMNSLSIPPLTVCGLEELESYDTRAVTHVLSILDPDWPDPDAFWAYDPDHWTILRFHDAIEPMPDLIVPEFRHVEAIMTFGRAIADNAALHGRTHLLVHCHAGISRSTAAMIVLLAQARPNENEDRLFECLLRMRPQAWPNSRMVSFADGLLRRGGNLTAALGRLYARQLRAKPELDDIMRRVGRGRELDLARTYSSRGDTSRVIQSDCRV